MRHGFASPTVWRGGFHTRTVPFNRYWHVSRNFRALAGGEDGTEIRPSAIPGFPVSEREREGLERKLAARGVPPFLDLVVLNPNAGTLSLERRWPASSFADLGRRLANEGDTAVVLVGSRAESDYTRHVARAARSENVFELAGELSIAELCALFERASAVVSNDSGPMHLAAALGTPTLGLFGPETPVMYAPIGERARYLWRPPVCSPCINVHENKVANCVRGRPECLVNLDVDRVHAEVRVLLEGKILHPFGPPSWRRAPTGTDGELESVEERGTLERDE
jgi:ADP-heptose:LPS heptosyltransferase